MDGVVPAKRSAAHFIDTRVSAKYRKVPEDADDDERSSNGYLNHDSQAPDEAQSLSIPGSDSHQAGAVQPVQSSIMMSGPAATTSQQAPSIAFTPLNIRSTAHDTNIQDSWSTPSQAPPARPVQTPDADERQLREPFGISSKGSPHTERTGGPGLPTHLSPPSRAGPTAAEREQLSHPLGLPQEEEQSVTQADRPPPALDPCPSSPRLEKASEELVCHLKTFTEDVQRRISDLVSGASLKQTELCFLQESRKDLLIERDELRGKLITEIREKEGYKKEVEDLKAELKRMKDEMQRVEEDKKKISGAYKTLEDLVGFIKR
ncbi:hypothetical protein BDW68DRAFT_172395 [Aspergillus falconensis]